MFLSLRPEQKKYVLIPVMLGLSFFLDHYKGRIGRTLQADAATWEFLDPACRPQPVSHTVLPSVKYLQRQFHHRAIHPTEKKLFELLDQQGSLGMYTKLPSPHLSHASSEFTDDIQRYKRTTELARILDYCHATWEEVTPIFMKWSQDGDLHNFPWYQWYVKLQYAYATHAKGMKRVVAPTFLAHIDSTATHQDIQAFINLFPTASSMGLPSFVSLEQDDTWSHTWHLEKDNVCRKIETTHLTHGQAQDDFEKAGIAICSSVCGFEECGGLADKGRTCLHGLQPIVLTGCTLLQQQVKEVFTLGVLPQLVIRGGTEAGHDGGMTRVGGQMNPQFTNKIILTGKRHHFTQGRLQGAYKLFALHGFGNTVDIGVYDASSAWAVHAFLDDGIPLIYGFRYRALGPDCFVIAQSHGKGAGLHHHVGFVTAVDMQYILDDLHGEGRNIHIDPHDTLMHERERTSESDDSIVPILDTMTDLLDTINIPPREHDK